MFTPPPSPRPIPVDTGSLTLESEASSSSRGRQSLSPDVPDRLSPSPSRSHREKRPPSIILTPPDEDMVSPLPSPLPALVVSSKEIPLSLSPAEKKRIGARTRLVSLVLVPLVLILITYTTRALSHPIALDIFSPSSEASWSSASDWSIHKRHPSPDSGSGSGQNSSTSLLFPTGGSATPTTTAASSTNSGGSALVPTVPADAPVLPTPFPQALDTTLGQNFTTKNCQDFFANMTQSVAFRSCRPLSLLIHSSSAFIDAQSNLTLYNDLIWGTCNTRTAVDQCNINIDWFRDTLQSACATELSGRNALATTTLTGLQAYSLMRQAGCLVNPSTNTYCLLDAVRATTASDIYYYGLPLGTPLPAGMTPTCSACSKSLLSLFAPSAKVNGASGNTTATLPALGNGVYSRAASVANAQCGQEFAVGASNGGNSVSRPASWLMVLATLVVAIIAL